MQVLRIIEENGFKIAKVEELGMGKQPSATWSVFPGESTIKVGDDQRVSAAFDDELDFFSTLRECREWIEENKK